MMLRQLLSLFALAICFSLSLAYGLTPRPDLAKQLVELAGASDAISLAANGPVAAFAYIKTHDLYLLLPWFLGGCAIAIIARLGLWRWTKPSGAVENVKLEDEAGGTVEMIGTSLSHDPGIHFMPTKPDPKVLPGATVFEHELMGVILAVDGLPRDLEGGLDTLLAEYVASAWKHIVAEHGSGSLASMLVLAHQTGKVLAYRKGKVGWAISSDKFAQQSSIVTRRTRSFYTLSRQQRDELMLCLSVLASNWVPVGMPEAMQKVLRDVRIADMVSPGENPTANTASNGEVDIRKIASLVSPSLLTQLATFNINQSRSKSESLDGLFLKKEMVLLVPPRQMREAFAGLLPVEVQDLLKLGMPATGRHPSDRILFQVLEATGELVHVLKHVNSGNGSYAVRSGQRKFEAMWALSTKNAKPEVSGAWGEWPLDIEILGQGDIHVG